MSRPATTPVRPAVRPTLGALLTVCALALVGAEARARPHFPSTLVIEPLRIQSRPSTNPGYLPLVGAPPLRWKNPSPAPPVPTTAPVVLYNPPAPPSTRTAGDIPRSGIAEGSTSEPEKPPQLKPKDFLPFFQRDGSAPPVKAGPTEGLMFAPARPALPTSSAEFHQQ